jgi:hypothetical protein
MQIEKKVSKRHNTLSQQHLTMWSANINLAELERRTLQQVQQRYVSRRLDIRF